MWFSIFVFCIVCVSYIAFWVSYIIITFIIIIFFIEYFSFGILDGFALICSFWVEGCSVSVDKKVFIFLIILPWLTSAFMSCSWQWNKSAIFRSMNPEDHYNLWFHVSLICFILNQVFMQVAFEFWLVSYNFKSALNLQICDFIFLYKLYIFQYTTMKKYLAIIYCLEEEGRMLKFQYVNRH